MVRKSAASRRRERKVGLSRLGLCGLVALTLAASEQPAVAQDQKDDVARPESPAGDDIVVTAQRRAQSVQDVPLSITALGAKDIERSGFTELDDYAVRIPNLSFSASGSSSTDAAMSVSIRGVFGSNTTGFYIDDSPLVAALNPRVVDLERIEVLRGPQGTLYGARSMGGTVRLITVKPSFDEMSARGHVMASVTRGGGFNHGVDGAINLPLIDDRLAVRLVAYHQENAGFIDRAPRADAPVQFPVRHNIDDETVNGAQLAASLSLLDGDLTIEPRIMYEKVERGGRTQADFSAGNRTNLRQFDIAEPSESDWWLGTLTVGYDAGFGRFLSASSWFDRHYNDTEDFSEWTTAIFGFQGASVTFSETDQRIFSQELRFVSDWGGPVALTTGLFYQKSDTRWVFPYTRIDGFSDDAFNLDNPTKVSEQAAFAELTWNVTDSLRLILGGRLFKNKVDFNLRQGGAFIGPDEFYSGVQRENGFTPKIGVQMDLDSERMIYATMSEGFRTGGVNFYSGLLCANEIAARNLGDVSSYGSDSLRSYELGIKSRWFDRRLTINAAAFHVDWSDLQQRQGLGCGFTLNLNAGKAKLQGFELEVDLKLGAGTRVTGGVGYVHSEITDNGGLTTVVKGDEIQNVPNLTWSAALDQDFRLGSLPAFAHVDYAYTGSSRSGNNNPTLPLVRPSFQLVNLRLGVDVRGARIALFAENLFDEAANYADIPPLGVQTPGRPRIVVNQPRTLGIEWRQNF
jgi:outer membrane receptor protein involved in Fe transport